jgi:hypothetical protein
MTRLNPTLMVNELVVLKEDRVVLSMRFHKGLNIVSGHNASGKTMTLDFVAYTLGAEQIPWKKEALLCTASYLEISLNGRVLTISREIVDTPMRPMSIFWGAMADALKASVAQWEIYPFKRSENKLSFSQVLLLAMDLPEAQGDGASNLTMHQFLRVLYADQPSLHSPIFRNDTYDSALTREAVGNYLAGVYDDRLFTTQLRKRDLEKKIQQAAAELKSIFTVLAKSEQDMNFEFLGSSIATAELQLTEHYRELELIKVVRSTSLQGDSSSGEVAARIALDNAKSGLALAIDKLARSEAEIADTESFIYELNYRLNSLEDSEVARGYFGKLAFNFCPCCLSEVKPLSSGMNSCQLCKEPLDKHEDGAPILRMRNELRLQLSESLKLIEARRLDASSLRSTMPGLKSQLRGLEQRYRVASQSWSTESELAVERIAKQIGVLEQEIRGLYENQRLGVAIKDLKENRIRLETELFEANAVIDSLTALVNRRKSKFELSVSNAVSRLLKGDLDRQPEFRSESKVEFSFIDNIIRVGGAARFAESSTVVLRHIFHLALLTASTNLPEMRFPRFLMIDGIEDGGMELSRSHRLQEMIFEECGSYEVDFQLIFATSQIAPSLDVEGLVVGRQFTKDRRAIDFL